jgi:VCBS repeat-containing protein
MLKAYRNGNLIGQIASGRTDIDPDITTTNFQLGAFYKPELIQAYEGFIDEVRIYSTELSQQTIINTLRTTLVGNEPGLVAYYPMSNGSGSVLTDDSVNENNGTLKNGSDIGSGTTGPQWVLTEIWDDPIANDQNVSLNEDSSIAITLTGSPVTPGAPLTFYLVDSPTHGSLSGTAPNLTYEPVGNYNGQDSFTFYVLEGSLVSGNATVAIDVIPVNDAPVAEDDSYSVNSGSVLNVNIATGVLANDNDIDEDSLTADLIVNVAHGVLTLNPNGSFTYTPDPTFFGIDQFTYKADDGELFSGETVVEITVVQTNFPLFLPFIMK